MGHFEIGDFDVIDVAGSAVTTLPITRDQIHDEILRILEANVLCSMATVTPEGAPHVSTAAFAYSDALELFFLSHPSSRHCRNLTSNPSIALTAFAPTTRWADPAVGIQAFGAAHVTSGTAAEDAQRCYGKRFPEYKRWRASLAVGDAGRDYALYRVVVKAVTILDEKSIADAVFVRAAIVSTPAARD